MSEITMPVDLAGVSAVKSFKGIEGKADAGLFGEVMSKFMAAAEVNADAAMISEADAAEVGNDGLMAGLAELMSVLQGGEEPLPENFSADSAALFIDSLKMFLSPNDEGAVSVKDIAAMWEKLPDSEKSAFAELLEFIASEEDVQADDAVSALASMCVKKLTDRAEDDAEEQNNDVAYLMMGIVHHEVVGAEKTAETDAVEMSEGINSALQNVDLKNNIQTVNAAQGTTADVQIKDSGSGLLQDVDIEENIQNVYSEIEEADPEELKKFCLELAGELKAQVEVSESNADNNAAELSKVFSSARQAVMSRANIGSTDENDNQIPAQDIIPLQTNEVFTVSETAETAQTPEITAQIIHRLDLVRMPQTGQAEEITLRLAPEELGDLEIRIKNTDEGIVIAFAAENSEAAGLIGDRAAALAEAVASKGLKLKEMTVTEQIITHEAENGGLDYSGSEFSGSFRNNQSDSEPSGERRFIFAENDDGSITAEVSQIGSQTQENQIYYNKEARLWVSA